MTHFNHIYRGPENTPNHHAKVTTTMKVKEPIRMIMNTDHYEVDSANSQEQKKKDEEESSSSKCLVTRKLKELEMMDRNNVDLVLDIEEVLHYYSRLTCPVYREIMDKFFVEMYSGTFCFSGRQMLLVGGESENVHLYYHMYDNYQIQFEREEFCLVTGLKFGVEYSDDYDDNDKPIPFRRRVFPSCLDGKRITGKDVEDLIESKSFKKLDDDDVVILCCISILELVLLGLEDRRAVPSWILWLANDRDGWDDYPWDSYVWPTLYYQLRDANTWILEVFRLGENEYYTRHRRYPRIVAWTSNKKFYRKMLCSFLHGRVPAKRLIPDEVEAGSGWWLSSRAYFDGCVTERERRPGHVNRQNHYEVPSDIYRDFQEQRSGLDQMMKQGQNIFEQMKKYMEELNVDTRGNKEPIIADRHYRISDLSGLQSIQSPYTSLPATTELPKKRVGRPKENSKNDNLSPLNLGNAFVHDNVGGDDVLITGIHDTGIYFTYENVDPNKLLELMLSKRSRKNTKCVNAVGEELTAAKHKLKLKLFKDIAAADDVKR
nr:hypothetical protein [Tanacetum cinerariifolium]